MGDGEAVQRKLSETQRSGVLLLLSYLTEHDLFSLARTVTNSLVPVQSVKDAQEAILLHEIDLRTFLTRRKITREIIFKYLHNKKIDIPASSEKGLLLNKLVEIWEQPSPNEIQTANYPTQNISQDNVVGDIDILAEKFVEWFYGILNEYLMDQESNNLCTDHFWNDCNMYMVMESSEESVVKDIKKDSKCVVSTLRELQMQHKLYFNPNVSKAGVRGKVDSHGLVLVMACGTLHQVNNYVGVFQQVFGLVRDPFMQNNWRIKTTSILLRSEQISKLPSLDDDCFNCLPIPL